MRALLSVFLLTIAGCGSYSMPGIDGEPDARGTWDMNFVPASPSPGAPTPAGMSLTIQIAQNGQTLSGTVVRVQQPAMSCFPPLSIAGTTFTTSGQLHPSVEAGANLFLTVTFVPTGTFAPTEKVDAQGALNVGSNIAAGAYTFGAGTGSCSQGTFNMTRRAS